MRTLAMPRPQRAKLSMVLQRLMRTSSPGLLFRHFLSALYQCIALLHQPELHQRRLLLVSQHHPPLFSLLYLQRLRLPFHLPLLRLWHLPPPLLTLAPPQVQTLHIKSTLLPLHHPTLQQVRLHPTVARQSTTSVRKGRGGNART
jgi:hypothetical protein